MRLSWYTNRPVSSSCPLSDAPGGANPNASPSPLAGRIRQSHSPTPGPDRPLPVNSTPPAPTASNNSPKPPDFLSRSTISSAETRPEKSTSVIDTIMSLSKSRPTHKQLDTPTSGPRSLSVTRREACRPLHGRAVHARHRQSARSRACFGQARSAPKESCPTGLGQPTLPRVCAQQISAGRRRLLHEDLLWAGVRCVHRRPVYSRRILGQRPAGRSRPRTGCR